MALEPVGIRTSDAAGANAIDSPTLVERGGKGPPIVGYLRYPALGPQRTAVVEEMQTRAAEYGGPLRQVYFEVASPVTVLWSLLEVLDKRSGGQLMPAVTEFGHTSGVDVRQMVAAGGARPVRWAQLTAELSRAGGGWLIVHSARDLDGLGEPRHEVLRRLEAMHVQVAYLRDSDSTSTRSGLPQVEAGTVIGQFKTKTFGLALEVAKSSVNWHLMRAGLTYLADVVVELLVDLIGRRMEATWDSDRPNELVVQLIRLPQSLVIETTETFDFTGEPIGEVAERICGPDGFRRSADAEGGTITRFEISLDTGDADTVRMSPDRRPA